MFMTNLKMRRLCRYTDHYLPGTQVLLRCSLGSQYIFMTSVDATWLATCAFVLRMQSDNTTTPSFLALEVQPVLSHDIGQVLCEFGTLDVSQSPIAPSIVLIIYPSAHHDLRQQMPRPKTTLTLKTLCV